MCRESSWSTAVVLRMEVGLVHWSKSGGTSAHRGSRISEERQCFRRYLQPRVTAKRSGWLGRPEGCGPAVPARGSAWPVLGPGGQSLRVSDLSPAASELLQDRAGGRWEPGSLGPHCLSTLAATLTPWASDSGKLTVPWKTRGEQRRWHRVQSCLRQGRWNCSFRGKWNHWPGGHEDRPRELPARPRPRTPGGRARVGFSSFYRTESEAGGGRGIHRGQKTAWKPAAMTSDLLLGLGGQGLCLPVAFPVVPTGGWKSRQTFTEGS